MSFFRHKLVLAKWFSKSETSTDRELLALVERIAAAAERQSLAVEAAQQASIKTSIAAAKKYAAETELIELETERRRR